MLLSLFLISTCENETQNRKSAPTSINFQKIINRHILNTTAKPRNRTLTLTQMRNSVRPTKHKSAAHFVNFLPGRRRVNKQHCWLGTTNIKKCASKSSMPQQSVIRIAGLLNFMSRSKQNSCSVVWPVHV